MKKGQVKKSDEVKQDVVKQDAVAQEEVRPDEYPTIGARADEAGSSTQAVGTDGSDEAIVCGGNGAQGEETDHAAEVMATETASGAATSSETSDEERHDQKEDDGLSNPDKDVSELLEGDPQKGESSGAIVACNDFLLLGQARSVRGLAQDYKEQPKHEVPTQSYDTLRRWSEKYGWPQRAEEYDARKRREHTQMRHQFFHDGHSNPLQRVATLGNISQLLEEKLLETGAPEEQKFVARCPQRKSMQHFTSDNLVDSHPNLFTTTVREVGEGENKRVTTTRRFNKGLLSELRGVMNDIAQETGGRRPQFVERVLERLDFNYLPSEFASQIYYGHNQEDALVELIETFYSKDPRVHLQRKFQRDRRR